MIIINACALCDNDQKKETVCMKTEDFYLEDKENGEKQIQPRKTPWKM